MGSVFVNFHRDRNDRGEDLLSLALGAEMAVSDFAFLGDPLLSFFKRGTLKHLSFTLPVPQEVTVSCILFKLQLDCQDVPAGRFQHWWGYISIQGTWSVGQMGQMDEVPSVEGNASGQERGLFN